MKTQGELTIGSTTLRISLDKADVRRLWPLEKALKDVPTSLKAGVDIYIGILMIALAEHHSDLRPDFFKRYSFIDLDAAAVAVMQFQIDNLFAICGHERLIGKN